MIQVWVIFHAESVGAGVGVKCRFLDDPVRLGVDIGLVAFVVEKQSVCCWIQQALHTLSKSINNSDEAGAAGGGLRVKLFCWIVCSQWFAWWAGLGDYDSGASVSGVLGSERLHTIWIVVHSRSRNSSGTGAGLPTATPAEKTAGQRVP